MVEPQMPDVSSSARLVRIAPPGEGTRTAFFIRDTTETVRRFGRTPGIAGRFQGVDWRERGALCAQPSSSTRALRRVDDRAIPPRRNGITTSMCDARCAVGRPRTAAP